MIREDAVVVGTILSLGRLSLRVLSSMAYRTRADFSMARLASAIIKEGYAAHGSNGGENALIVEL